MIFGKRLLQTKLISELLPGVRLYYDGQPFTVELPPQCPPAYGVMQSYDFVLRDVRGYLTYYLDKVFLDNHSGRHFFQIAQYRKPYHDTLLPFQFIAVQGRWV